MTTVVTSKEDILKTSRKLIRQQGWSAVNIRPVAAVCGVSVAPGKPGAFKWAGEV